MRPLKSPKLPSGLRNTISYFSFFGYAPSFEHIFTFFPEKTGKKQLRTLLGGLSGAKKLLEAPFAQENTSLYTLPQYSMHIRNRAIRREITKRKLGRAQLYLRLLAGAPFVSFVGITGSAAMGNSKEGDDVDICIVTSPKLLFTGRFWAIFLAGLMGVRDPKEGVCLNLFFDEADLAVPEKKRTLYVAHEVLQLLPICDKNNVYDRFLAANSWVKRFFPNAAIPGKNVALPKAKLLAKLLQPLEHILKRVELGIIRKNRTGHLITPTQLWLFRTDFGEKLRRKIKRS